MEDYEVKIQHDHGIAIINIAAFSEESARNMVCKAEGCPPSAIISVTPKN